jgi:16S rRNA processing protein RimM
MQAFDEYYFLGKILKPHGFDGKVNTYLDTDEPWLYENLEMVFININGSPVPFFVESIILKNNKATIKFADVATIEQSTFLIQKEMYLPLASLPPLSGNKFYFHEVIGFTVKDLKFGEIGIVKQILEYPNQAVLQVMHKEKEVLIPASHDVIKLVDRTKKEIEVDAPDGLIEIYLQ